MPELHWREVVEGDQVKSMKNGKFYLVVKTLAVQGGKVEVTIQAGAKQVKVVRPSAEEPKAVVIRGDTGAAVDVFLSVFSSN